MKLSDKLNLEYFHLKKQKGTFVNSQKIANRKYHKQVTNILKELLVHQNQIKKNLK
jgi:molybdate-binding protein